ncbi:MAG: trypsin-like peptidase domain-containing protein [Planctomycetes bacterium]|nr:trypsin-like peptidase domain-containing protein [Planctomycetota bacterium]MCB9890668.1 trypsin-like peptidase domain-containing protein [Planctomycetota bacterium]MCB9920109.1 trypsin-like peptidase domain-containing protein [Planctomycetota bacterium]
MGEPSESAHFAFQELARLAHADGMMLDGERSTLERFARHLGIPSHKARRYYKLSRRRAREFPEDPQRQLDLLVMLARVAYSDGVLQEAERRYFERLTDEFGIPRTRLAHVLEQAETHADRHARIERRWLCATALGLLAALTITWIVLANKPDEMTGFKELDDRLRPSLLLVHTRFRLVHDHEPARFQSATGTAFFVSTDGLAITNKHVVRPWLFSGSAQDLLAEGYRIDEASVETLAWQEGQRVLDDRRRPIDETAFSTNSRTLQVVGTAPDAVLPMSERASHLRKEGLFCHANDNGDLALLRCTVRGPVVIAPLAAESASVRRLDPVMVLGYPRGLHLLESNFAASTPTVGRVRKNEATIYVTAPIVPGNSGGPLFDHAGHVIGIATRTFGSATLAGCLRVEHAHALLGQAR